jgi:hypothetical protein
MATASLRRLISPLSRSSGLVTGMKIAVPARSAGIGLFPAYGATIRDEGHREHAEWAGPMYRMSRELALVAGRPCDLPGCAESADP